MTGDGIESAGRLRQLAGSVARHTLRVDSAERACGADLN